MTINFKHSSVGPFTVGHSDQAGTTSVFPVKTRFFNNKGPKRDFGVSHFELNVVDTPGFADPNSENDETNAQNIGNSLDFGVNAFILVMVSSNNPRFPQNEVKIMKKFHEWTNGRFWKNLIILSRREFSRSAVMQSAEDDVNFWKPEPLVESFENNILKLDLIITVDGFDRKLNKVKFSNIF